MEIPNVPFVTRKMLVFDEQSMFQLEILTMADTETIVEIQGMTKEGIFRYNFTTQANSQVLTTNLGIPDAPVWLTMKYYFDNAGANDVYAMVYLKINGIKTSLLCQGNLGHIFGISWPNQVQTAPLQARGKDKTYRHTIVGTGVEQTVIVPGGEHWILKGIQATLTTSGDQASRYVMIEIIFKSGAHIFCLATYTQPENTRYYYSWYVGASNVYVDLTNRMQQSLVDDMILPPDTEIHLIAENTFDADIWDEFHIIYEKFYSNI